MAEGLIKPPSDDYHSEDGISDGVNDVLSAKTEKNKAPTDKKTVLRSLLVMITLVFGTVIICATMPHTVIKLGEALGFVNKDDFYEVKTEIRPMSAAELDEAYEKKQTEELYARILQRIKDLRPRLDPMLQNHYTNLIIKYSKEYDLPASLVLHVIFRESRFDQLATSRIEAAGLMQINYNAHKKELEAMGIDQYTIFHFDNNFNFGCSLLKKYIKQSDSLSGALTKYVGGKHKTYVSDIFTAMADFQVTHLYRDSMVKTETFQTKDEEDSNDNGEINDAQLDDDSNATVKE